jgi:hypothetical protein
VYEESSVTASIVVAIAECARPTLNANTHIRNDICIHPS